MELRSWNTYIRGKFLIHASKDIDKERSDFLGVDHNKIICRAIIGAAILYDIKQYRRRINILQTSKNLAFVGMDSW